mmetsp:Transcript_31101/g.58342  ORF Transcript_31101/g.58342 Transcript_31101/m.58342 type:complete len:119 (+) Transcript_31101:54-410(+)
MCSSTSHMPFGTNPVDAAINTVHFCARFQHTVTVTTPKSEDSRARPLLGTYTSAVRMHLQPPALGILVSIIYNITNHVVVFVQQLSRLYLNLLSHAHVDYGKQQGSAPPSCKHRQKRV